MKLIKQNSATKDKNVHIYQKATFWTVSPYLFFHEAVKCGCGLGLCRPWMCALTKTAQRKGWGTGRLKAKG